MYTFREHIKIKNNMKDTLRYKKIGIPRAISYYNNYPFYYGFFKSLGLEIILSDKTTTAIINSGTKYVVSDTCLPVKVYAGHVVNLLEKGCEAIFIPSIQSTDYKINNCSKIRGLPEIIRNIINKPFTIIQPTLDKTEGLGFYDFWTETANALGIKDQKTIKNAVDAGWKIYDDFMTMTNSGVSYNEALQNAIEGKLLKKTVDIVKPLSVVIMAHGYNLFDERISLNLIKKLEKMGVKVYTSLNISREQSQEALKKLGEIQYWANELELTGCAAHYLLNKKVDGIIALSAFGCGPDSLMVDEISHHCKEKGMPLIHLTIDEHTGEAGFITRIEAFVDMLMRKKRNTLIQNAKPKAKADIINIKKEKILTGSAK